MGIVPMQAAVSPAVNTLGGQGWRQAGELGMALLRGFAIDDLAAEPVSSASAAHGTGGEPAMIAVTMHVRGKRPVSELASALTELDLVGAVIARAERTGVPWENAQHGEVDEAAIASAEPGGVGLARRTCRWVRCPKAGADRTDQADPQVDPHWRAAGSHRADAPGPIRAHPARGQAPGVRGSARDGWDHSSQRCDPDLRDAGPAAGSGRRARRVRAASPPRWRAGGRGGCCRFQDPAVVVSPHDRECAAVRRCISGPRGRNVYLPGPWYDAAICTAHGRVPAPMQAGLPGPPAGRPGQAAGQHCAAAAACREW